MKLLFFCAFLVTNGCAQVIFDTDCAIFNDDGAALVMLLNSHKDVAGLTLVPGNFWPATGAGYMSHILQLMHRDIPIYYGAQAPLLHTREMALKETGIEYLGAFQHVAPVYSGPTKAIDFILDTVKMHPGKVTILELGPMTNLAIMLRLRPDLASKIGTLVFMGGAMDRKEFNFWFDPEAAQIVLRSSIAKKVMFGLEICDRAPIDKTHAAQITAKTPIGDLYRQDRARNPQPYVWDVLAAAYLVDPGFVTKHETKFLDVDAHGVVVPLDRSIAPDATPVEVMTDLDFERFFSLYKSLIH